MKLFHLSLATLLTLILTLLTTTPTTITTTTTNHPLLLASLSFSALALLLLYRRSCPRLVLLVDYTCYKPDFDRCSSEAYKYFIFDSRRFSRESESFISDILAKSGVGDEVYAPPLVFQTDNTDAKLRSAVQEAEEGMFSAVDSLLDKTHIHPSMIDILIVACSVNKYKLNPDIKTYKEEWGAAPPPSPLISRQRSCALRGSPHMH
ncbi:3-ketoacyl-CoA synthase 12 [Acorus calamus]|uniref:3-ketoacyl-CoA synthase 12 n=1 Tax=Acorus calamus TaxID=4465 RepID=A0AAV9DXE4_ACOCL|nr:3-ketoacyl-CoA synthase 12 [Acorus calamus]